MVDAGIAAAAGVFGGIIVGYIFGVIHTVRLELRFLEMIVKRMSKNSDLRSTSNPDQRYH